MNSVSQHMTLYFDLAVLIMDVQQGMFCPYLTTHHFVAQIYGSWFGKVANVQVLVWQLFLGYWSEMCLLVLYKKIV